MKGIASWIWVIGSVLFGIILFYAGYVLISGQMSGAAESITTTQISGLNVELRRICISEGIGAYRTYEISLPESVKAVYIAKSKYSPAPDKVSALITDKEAAVGNYLCYQLSSNEANLPQACWNYSCSVNFTYIGTPTMKKTLASVLAHLTGRDPVYSYRLHLTKTGEHAVLVTAEPILKK